MSWLGWRRHFERNARRPLPDGAIEAARIDPARRAALARSLAKFQLGEAGEGRIAREIDRVLLAPVDDDYRVALKLFVAEEGRHARLLGRCVRGLGGRLLRANWTNRLFTFGRRAAGVRLKLLVLLAAEVLGIGFYRLLAGRLPAGELRAVLDEICTDESAHLAFHADFFRRHCTGALSRGTFRLAWWVVGAAACASVLADHAATLRTFGIPLGEAARGFVGLLGEVDGRVSGAGVPVAAPARPASAG